MDAPAKILHVLGESVGGSICLVSTVLYNIALLAGFEIVERYCHSVDTYGAARYFELGRDAAVEFAYRDLRFRNPHSGAIVLNVSCSGDEIIASARALRQFPLHISIRVDEPIRLSRQNVGKHERTFASDSIAVRTWRTRRDQHAVEDVEDLGWSVHDSPRSLT